MKSAVTRLLCAALTLVVVVVALSGALPPAPAAAHVSTIGYSRITATDTSVTWTLWLDPYHLNTFLTLDEDNDASIGDAEVRGQEEAIRRLVASGLQAMNVDSGESPPAVGGAVSLTTMAATGLSGEGFTELAEFPLVEVPVTFEFVALDPDALQLTYGLFLEIGFGDHNNVAKVEIEGWNGTFTFGPEEPAIVSGKSPTSDGDQGFDARPVAFIAVGVALTIVIAVIQRRSKPNIRTKPGRRSGTGRISDNRALSSQR